MRRVVTILLAACALIVFASMFIFGSGRELLAAFLFVLGAIFGLLAVAVHHRFDRGETRALALLAVLVFPLIALGGAGLDLPETVHPIDYFRDREYRAAAHERWRASKLRFVGDMFGLFALVFLAACVIGFWVAAAYVVIHLIRHGALPSWA